MLETWRVGSVRNARATRAFSSGCSGRFLVMRPRSARGAHLMAVGVTRHGRYWGPCARLMVGTGDGVDAAAISASGSSSLLRLKWRPPGRIGMTGFGLTWMSGGAAGSVAVRVSPEGLVVVPVVHSILPPYWLGWQWSTMFGFLVLYFGFLISVHAYAPLLWLLVCPGIVVPILH